MSIYTKIGEKILANPNIIRPHVKTKDISQLNFKKMKDMGMEKIIFSKDNTLTLPGKSNFIDDKLKDALKLSFEEFGLENTYVASDLTHDEGKWGKPKRGGNSPYWFDVLHF